MRVWRVWAPAWRVARQADLWSLDPGAKFAFGEVVFGRDTGDFRPVVEAVGVEAEDVLDRLEGRGVGGTFDDMTDGLWDPGGLAVELAPSQATGAELHGQGEWLGQGGDKAQDFPFVGGILLEVLHEAQQVREAVLDLAGGLVVARVSVHDQVAGQRGLAQDLADDPGGPGLAKREDLQVLGAK